MSQLSWRDVGVNFNDANSLFANGVNTYSKVGDVFSKMRDQIEAREIADREMAHKAQLMEQAERQFQLGQAMDYLKLKQSESQFAETQKLEREKLDSAERIAEAKNKAAREAANIRAQGIHAKEQIPVLTQQVGNQILKDVDNYLNVIPKKLEQFSKYVDDKRSPFIFDDRKLAQLKNDESKLKSRISELTDFVLKDQDNRDLNSLSRSVPSPIVNFKGEERDINDLKSELNSLHEQLYDNNSRLLKHEEYMKSPEYQERRAAVEREIAPHLDAIAKIKNDIARTQDPRAKIDLVKEQLANLGFNPKYFSSELLKAASHVKTATDTREALSELPSASGSKKKSGSGSSNQSTDIGKIYFALTGKRLAEDLTPDEREDLVRTIGAAVESGYSLPDAMLGTVMGKDTRSVLGYLPGVNRNTFKDAVRMLRYLEELKRRGESVVIPSENGFVSPDSGYSYMSDYPLTGD